MNTLWSRRDLMRLAAWMGPFHTLAAQHRGKVKITGIRAMQIRNIAGNCLIRIDTDAGLSGYGEAGATGPMARARIETMKSHLIGQDPLAIEVHFLNMTSLMHTYMAHIPTVSGIDIALWDLAGKITGQPVSVLLGGPFRPAIPMYSHGRVNMLDKSSCRDWAQQIKAQPEGFTAYKNNIDPLAGVRSARYAFTLSSDQLRNIGRGFANAREAVGDEIDVAVHCHNEFDTLSSINVAKAVEPMNPLFLEDPLPVAHMEGWDALRRSTRIPILAGEKLELVRGFRPFLDNQSANIIHPDLAFAGGITGVRKIADYAMLTRTPVALHNVGSLVLTYASAHFGASIHNFFRSESALGRPDRYQESMAATGAPEVRKGLLTVPAGPGLGVHFNEDVLKKNLVEGEPYWG